MCVCVRVTWQNSKLRLSTASLVCLINTWLLITNWLLPAYFWFISSLLPSYFLITAWLPPAYCRQSDPNFMIYTHQLHFCTFVFTQSHNHTFDLLLPLRLSNEDTGVAANPCCSAKPVSDTSSCEYVMLCVMRLGHVAEINTPHTQVIVYMCTCEYVHTCPHT